MEKNFKSLLRIFFVTLRIGAFTFGGGYAMIPLMQDEFVNKNKWIDEKDIVDVFAVAPSVPGVLAVNASILIGNKIAGLSGGFIAALGCIIPPFVIMSIVQRIYVAFFANMIVIGALRGIKAAVVALMLTAVVNLMKQSFKDIIGVIIAACVIIASFLPTLGGPSVNPVYLLIGAALAGLLIKRGRGA